MLGSGFWGRGEVWKKMAGYAVLGIGSGAGEGGEGYSASRGRIRGRESSVRVVSAKDSDPCALQKLGFVRLGAFE